MIKNDLTIILTLYEFGDGKFDLSFKIYKKRLQNGIPFLEFLIKNKRKKDLRKKHFWYFFNKKGELFTNHDHVLTKFYKSFGSKKFYIFFINKTHIFFILLIFLFSYLLSPVI